jgi:hypothetical protein
MSATEQCRERERERRDGNDRVLKGKYIERSCRLI